jgi:hypothetical protein
VINNGNYMSFPGLTATNVASYCPDKANATVLGHLTQVKQGLQSTSNPTTHTAANAGAAYSARHPSNDKILHAMGLAPPATALFCWEEELDTLYTDDMGRFPIRAQNGNQYIMLAYHAGANTILVQPFQTKADHHRIPTYQAIMARLKARNIRVSQQVLDNEASAAYKQAINIDLLGCTIQFVPPDMH